jgi:O-antigen ligase
MKIIARENLLPALAAALWCIVLIPMSVDNRWSIPVGSYDLRVNYFGAAFSLALLAFLRLSRPREYGPWLESAMLRKENLFFALMGASGLIASFFSANASRSFFILVWSVGTLLFVPLVLRFHHKLLGPWIPRTLLLYLLLQSLVILVDFSLCNLSGGGFRLGRVQISSLSIYLENFPTICKPHAWYQVPGYFSGFALFSILAARLWMRQEADYRWSILARASYAFAALAIVLSLSRMGMAAVFCLLALDTFLFFRGRWKSGSLFAPAYGWRTKFALLCAAIALSLALYPAFRKVLPSLVMTIKVQVLSHSIFQSDPGPYADFRAFDSSTNIRFATLGAAWRVFEENKIWGAGPGAAGAYLVSRMPGDIFLEDKTPDQKELMRRDPLSQGLFLELLSEWGLLGTLLFLGGLLLFLRGSQATDALALAICILPTYFALETLPRFDLWLVLALVTVLTEKAARQREMQPR